MTSQTMVAFQEGWKRLYDDGVLVLEDFLQTGKIRPNVQQPSSSSDGATGSGSGGAGRAQRIFSCSDYTELYTIVYDMCTQRRPNNWSQHLYQKYGETMTNYITKKVLISLQNRTSVDLLKHLAKAWSDHQLYVKWMSKFFTYLDRYYVKLQAVPSLSCKGYAIFHSHIFAHVAEETRTALLQVIRSERQAEMESAGIILGASSSSSAGASGSGGGISGVNLTGADADLISLDQQGQQSSGLLTYVSEFERHFLPDSKEFYQRQAAGWLEKHSFPEYLLQAERALKNESARVRSYLHPTTESKLKSVLIEAMFNAQSRRMLLDKPSSINWLLENDKKDDLLRAHKLFGFVEGGLIPIAALFKQHVTNSGMSVVDERVARSNDTSIKKTDIGNDPEFIQKLLDLHEHYKTLVGVSFSQDSLFQKSLKEAFEVFVNRDLGRVSFAQLMSSFCNRLLKKTGPSERIPDDEIEARLTKIVELFNFLSDKDLFSEIYRGQLAKRLLEESSASDDAERSMVGKLKLKCGAQFTSKLEGMLNDLSLALDQKRKFDDWCRDEKRLAIGSNMYLSDISKGAFSDNNMNDDGTNKEQEGGATSSTAAAQIAPHKTTGSNDTLDIPSYTDTGPAGPNDKITLEFAVTVLATGYWPTYQGVECKLPRQMTVCLDIFGQYYGVQTQHRKLTWIHNLGQATLAARFRANRRHDLVGSTLQAVVLLLFADSGVNGNKETEHTVGSIQKELSTSSSSSPYGGGGTKGVATANSQEGQAPSPNTLPLDVSSIKRVLGTLACSKHRVLSIKRDGQILEAPKGVNESDILIVNDQFYCDRRKVKLPTASAGAEDVGKSGSMERVEEDRSIAVEAAIVRIMKARRTLQHSQLVAEVLQQLHFFRPEPKLIKHRIEHLIDREYLERDSDNSNCYRYLA